MCHICNKHNIFMIVFVLYSFIMYYPNARVCACVYNVPYYTRLYFYLFNKKFQIIKSLYAC